MTKKAVIFLAKNADSDDVACSKDVGEMLEGGGWAVSYAGFGELAHALAAKPNLYVQPGGNYDVKEIFHKLTKGDKEGVKAYVEAGGAYLGICLGAFLAGKGFYELALMDKGEIEDKKGLLKAQLVDVTWAGVKRQIYVEEPPELGKMATSPTRHIHSQFTDGSANVVVEKCKLGIVGLIAGHPEAKPDWGSKKLKVPVKLAQDIGVAVAHLLVERKL